MPKKTKKRKEIIIPKEPSSSVYRAGVRRLNKCIDILGRYSLRTKEDRNWPIEYLAELVVYLEYLQRVKYKAELREKRKNKGDLS